jgi:hypothetical protein
MALLGCESQRQPTLPEANGSATPTSAKERNAERISVDDVQWTPIDAELPKDITPRYALPFVGCPPSRECKLKPPPAAAMADAPLALWIIEGLPGARFRAEKDDRLDISGFVLREAVDVIADPDRQPKRLTGLHAAFHAPGAGITIRVPDSLSATVLIVFATRDGQPLFDRGPGASWRKRAGLVEAFSFAERPALPWYGGAHHARVGWEASDGAVLSTLLFRGLSVMDMPPRTSWECTVVLRGSMLKRGLTFVSVRWDKDQLRKWFTPPNVDAFKQHLAQLGAGEAGCVPPGEPSAFVDGGEEAVVALQVFAPPGPERQYFAPATGTVFQ